MGCLNKTSRSHFCIHSSAAPPCPQQFFQCAAAPTMPTSLRDPSGSPSPAAHSAAPSRLIPHSLQRHPLVAPPKHSWLLSTHFWSSSPLPAVLSTRRGPSETCSQWQGSRRQLKRGAFEKLYRLNPKHLGANRFGAPSNSTEQLGNGEEGGNSLDLVVGCSVPCQEGGKALYVQFQFAISLWGYC